MVNLFRLGEKSRKYRIDSFRPVIAGNLGDQDVCRAKSWEYLKHHADICYLLALSLQANARDIISVSKLLRESAAGYVRGHEAELQPVLDV